MKDTLPFWRGRRGILAVFALLTLTGLGCGCGTTRDAGEDAAPGIRLVDAQNLSINGRVTPLPKSGARARAAGYDTRATVRIEVPEDTPHATLAAITRAMAEGGFRRILFATPRQAEAFTRPKP